MGYREKMTSACGTKKVTTTDQKSYIIGTTGPKKCVTTGYNGNGKSYNERVTTPSL